MSNDPGKTNPEIVEAYTRTVFLREIGATFKVRIPMWEGAQPRDAYALRLAGVTVEGGKDEESEVYADRLTRQEVDNGFLEISLNKSLLTQYVDQTHILLKFSASVNGQTVTFAWTRYRIKHDHVALTKFNRGQMEDWLPGAMVDPADLTFVNHDGKPCLRFNVEKELPKKTIISKAFNLSPGERYMFEAGIIMPRTKPQKFIYMILQEGSHASYWAFGSHLGQAHYIELGVKGHSSGITTLEIVASDTSENGTGNASSILIADIAVSRFNPSRPWDEEWDTPWEDGGDHPVKDPQYESTRP